MVQALLLLSLLLSASVSLTLAGEQTVGSTSTDRSASASTNSAGGTPSDGTHFKLVDDRTDAGDSSTDYANSSTSNASTTDSSRPAPGVFDAAPFSEPAKNLSTNPGPVRTESAPSQSQPTSGTNNTVSVTSPPPSNDTHKSTSSPQNKPSGSTLYGLLLSATIAGIQLLVL
ncbi:uncharacterized protein MELLADRAFT_123729 [Melampsora larici-populina 98AG31]|uniref:Secreted protein n=1 Tax=Melampsora larici-populina (strain 98AG31 / pathotype 3-4-7) TaxID=747676 RepID=F4RXV2_MELLP|nr:uncharacterized protein MELLADRAFT_123729 [Melampsora larici-populina 98AG31]EGG02835.1 secreted protein [Melampsora larici-populina 98AG31]